MLPAHGHTGFSSSVVRQSNQIQRDANDPCCSAYLPSSKSIMGLARIERAKPLFVQTLDVVGAFTTARVPPFLRSLRCRQEDWGRSPRESKPAVHPARRIY